MLRGGFQLNCLLCDWYELMQLVVEMTDWDDGAESHGELDGSLMSGPAVVRAEVHLVGHL